MVIKLGDNYEHFSRNNLARTPFQILFFFKKSIDGLKGEGKLKKKEDEAG